jgi:putative transposase
MHGRVKAFWRLYYHAVWATKNRIPLIDDGMIEPITRAVEETTRDLGVTVFAVGVMPDHIHVFAQIAPSVEVAAVIGRWKGASSHAANEFRPMATAKLAWQTGYGVLSVSQSGFDRARDYVLNQRERHAKRELYGILERIDDDP